MSKFFPIGNLHCNNFIGIVKIFWQFWWIITNSSKFTYHFSQGSRNGMIGIFIRYYSAMHLSVCQSFPPPKIHTTWYVKCVWFTHNSISTGMTEVPLSITTIIILPHCHWCSSNGYLQQTTPATSLSSLLPLSQPCLTH